MSRKIIVGAAQLGPIARNENRRSVVARLLELMREAKSRGCHFIVYPELALTTFFPRWYFPTQPEVDAWFEREMPGPETQILFDEARRLEMGFYLGYAEIAEDTEGSDGTHHYNTAIMVDPAAKSSAKSQDHLPGHTEHRHKRAFSTSGKTLLRVRQSGFSGLPGAGWRTQRHFRHGTVQRPPLAGNTPSARSAGMEMSYRLQHADPFLVPERHLAGLPQSAADAGRRLPERHVGRRCGQGRQGEGCDLLGQSCIIALRLARSSPCSAIGDELAHRFVRPRPLQGTQGQRLQFRTAPRAPALPADRRNQGCDRAVIIRFHEEKQCRPKQEGFKPIDERIRC